jgi:hypothetical protein
MVFGVVAHEYDASLDPITPGWNTQQPTRSKVSIVKQSASEFDGKVKKPKPEGPGSERSMAIFDPNGLLPMLSSTAIFEVVLPESLRYSLPPARLRRPTI